MTTQRTLHNKLNTKLEKSWLLVHVTYRVHTCDFAKPHIKF